MSEGNAQARAIYPIQWQSLTVKASGISANYLKLEWFSVFEILGFHGLAENISANVKFFSADLLAFLVFFFLQYLSSSVQ